MGETIARGKTTWQVSPAPSRGPALLAGLRYQDIGRSPLAPPAAAPTALGRPGARQEGGCCRPPPAVVGGRPGRLIAARCLGRWQAGGTAAGVGGRASAPARAGAPAARGGSGDVRRACACRLGARPAGRGGSRLAVAVLPSGRGRRARRAPEPKRSAVGGRGPVRSPRARLSRQLVYKQQAPVRGLQPPPPAGTPTGLSSLQSCAPVGGKGPGAAGVD